eukprot:TRINITY_DN8917_c0_g1_i1.p1 TRINITY_DN8917_c0_g1~~TRINITY_DN8917_c0_g1_i1.p1  ORF type:complete len:1795 (-),score=782.65 TRINITY_DN8917_c0_g1_i1:248-5632(-)
MEPEPTEVPQEIDSPEITERFQAISTSQGEADIPDVEGADDLAGDENTLAAPVLAAAERGKESPSVFVQRVYAALRPRFLDLLGDSAASEVFVIDGDSLLLELLADPKLDTAHGGQLLHLMYRLEQFLGDLRARSASFIVVFFQVNRALYGSSTSELVQREAAIRHLQCNTKLTVLTHFANWWQADWMQFLVDTHPTFVVVHDGELLPARLAHDDVRTMLRSFVIHSLANRQSVVYTAQMGHRDSKIVGFVARAVEAFGAFKPQLAGVVGLVDGIVAARAEPQRALFDYSIAEVREQFAEINSNPAFAPFLSGGVRAAIGLLACGRWLRLLTSGAPPTHSIDCVKAFLIHLVLLEHLPLRSRCQDLDAVLSKLGAEEHITHASEVFWPTLERHVLPFVRSDESVQPPEGDAPVLNFCDLWDGRLFYRVLSHLISSDAKTPSMLGFTAPMLAALEAAWAFIQRETGLGSPLFPLISRPSVAEPPAVPLPAPFRAAPVFPLQAPLVDQVLGDSTVKRIPILPATDHAVRAVEDDTRRALERLSGVQYDLSLEEDLSYREKDPDARRQYQRYLDFVHKYAESLEGSNVLHQRTIISRSGSATSATKAEPKEKEKEEKQKPAKGGGGGGKKPAGGPKKLTKEDIIAANKQKAIAEAEAKALTQWNGVKTMAAAESKLDSAKAIVDRFLSGPAAEAPGAALLASLYRLELTVRSWKDVCLASSGAPKSYAPAVELFKSVHDIVDRFLAQLDADQLKELTMLLVILGFEDSAQHVVELAKAAGKKVPSVSRLKKDIHPSDVGLSVGMSACRFQLTHMGHLLARKVNPNRDERVSFNPDDWQRLLLDAVDRNESAMVCAPTSSGKTFISYYAMEKVLQNSDDGIVVYVSPTKALVNQVAADVYARFGGKRYPKHPGRTVYGVYTESYKHNPLNCQVLITTPAILESLLLSPEHRDNWVSLIRYVIFDEVHCIGFTEEGAVWEHLLLLIRCPFLAMSATVGNPHQFADWLQKAQDVQKELARKRKAKEDRVYHVLLIQHYERYSDLIKYIYLPPYREDPVPIKSVQKLPDGFRGEWPHMHPAAAVGVARLKADGFPGDLTFTPEETIQVYEAMSRVSPESEREALAAFHPDTYFKEKRIITRPDARKYESDVKARLISWARSGHEGAVQKTLERLSGAVEALRNTEQEWASNGTEVHSMEFLKRNVVSLLVSLADQDKLPVIMFNFDRFQCEELTRTIVEQLEDVEVHKAGSEEGQRLRKLREKMRLKLEKIAKRSQKKKKSKEEKDDEKFEESAATEDESAIDPTLTFVRDGEQVSPDEMKRFLWGLRYTMPKDDVLIRALHRGIGVHHPGLPNKYRVMVERLFRARHLKVVIATETLALGIHMPCRTVVFAGDHVQLTPLQYRQMSGRAGRRGFDLLGHVIFFGVPAHKIRRLLTSEVPVLAGHFPFTSSLVLRLMVLYQKVQDKQGVLESIVCLMRQPFFALGHEQIGEQVKYHFRYALEYLLREGLIGASGDPIGLAYLTSHVYSNEPENFVFASLLKEGVLQRVCANWAFNKPNEVVMHDLLLLLAHLFRRKPLHVSSLADETLKTAPSGVILERLPEQLATTIAAHGRKALDVFASYARSFAATLGAEHRQLPVSLLEFPESRDFGTAGGLLGVLQREAVPFVAASPFVATSEANPDRFDSVQQLVSSVRNGVYLEPNALPILEGVEDGPLNGFVVDFFNHGSLKVLRTWNGIPEAFHDLKEFKTMLTTMTTSLNKLMPNSPYAERQAVLGPNDRFLGALNQLNDLYTAKFEKLEL